MAKSSRQCWYPAAGQVVVDVGQSAIAHVSQVHRCGSSWSCPVCAPTIRAARADEVDRGVSAHLDAGGGAELVTLTVGHHRRDQLDPRLGLVTEALRLTLKGSGWDRRRRRLEYVGTIRAVEITYGRHGWHPHLHALVLFERPLSDLEREDLTTWIRGRWEAQTIAAGFGRLHRTAGVDVRRVTSAGELGQYLTKVEGGWTVGHELARGDRKSSNGGLTPFELLHRLASDGDAADLALWLEYEQATFGRRSLRWSPGLRARLLGDEADRTDEELAAAEGADLTVVQALIDAMAWRRSVVQGATAELLDDIEDGARLVMALVLAAGHPLRPLPTKEVDHVQDLRSARPGDP